MNDAMKDVESLQFPMAACWNTGDHGGGWDPQHYLDLLERGYRVMPTIRVPILAQGANSESKWTAWDNKWGHVVRKFRGSPITLRFHNWLSDMTARLDNPYVGGYWRREPLQRQESPLAWRKLADGSLDDLRQPDALGPISAWREEGTRIGSSLWLKNLADQYIGDDQVVYLLENNEVTYHKEWRPEVWKRTETKEWVYSGDKHELERCNLRVSEALEEIGSIRQKDILRYMGDAYATKRIEMHGAIRAACPWDNVYIGGFGAYGADARNVPHRRIHNHGVMSNGNHIFDTPSHRVYDAKHHRKFWDDRDESPQYKSSILRRIWKHDRPNAPFHEISFWIEPLRDFRSWEMKHNGPIGPVGTAGMITYILWATRQAGKSTVVRWYVGSKYRLDDLWYFKPAWREKLAKAGLENHWTQRHYWEAVLDAVNMVSTDQVLRRFWLEGVTTSVSPTQVVVDLPDKRLVVKFDPREKACADILINDRSNA